MIESDSFCVRRKKSGEL